MGVCQIPDKNVGVEGGKGQLYTVGLLKVAVTDDENAGLVFE